MTFKAVMKTGARPPPRPAFNLTGNVYGLLTVLERHGIRNGSALWLCRCTCGETKLVRSDALRSNGDRQSCGNPICRRKLRTPDEPAEEEAIDHEPAEAAHELDDAMRGWPHDKGVTR